MFWCCQLGCQKFYWNICFNFQFLCINFVANYVADTHLLKSFLKGCGKSINLLLLLNQFWRKLGSCFFEHLGIVWYANRIQFEVNTLLMFFVKVDKHGLDWSVDSIFSHNRWGRGRNGGGFSRGGNVLIGTGSCVYRGRHDDG